MRTVRSKVRNWVGNGVERLVPRALVGQPMASRATSRFAQAYPIFLALYAENTRNAPVSARAYVKGLDYLRSKGYLLGCVTNKAAQFPCRCSRTLGIRRIVALWSGTPCR